MNVIEVSLVFKINLLDIISLLKWLKDFHRLNFKHVQKELHHPKSDISSIIGATELCIVGSAAAPSHWQEIERFFCSFIIIFLSFPPFFIHMLADCVVPVLHKMDPQNPKAFCCLFCYFLLFYFFPSLSDVKGNCGVVCFWPYLGLFFAFCIIKELNGDVLQLRRASFLTSVMDSKHILQNVQKIDIY